MEAAPSLWLSWLLALAGLAPVALYVARTLGAALNVPAFTAVVCKLLDAGNAERAEKLTRAAGGVPVAVATRAALFACSRGVAQGDPTADYRRPGDLSPERVLAPVRAAYDEAFLGSAAPLRRARYAALAGSVLLVAALVVPTAPAASMVAVGGLLGLVWGALRERSIRASRDTFWAALADRFDALLRDPGRAPRERAPTRVRVAFEVSEPGRAVREVEVSEEVVRVGATASAQVRLDAPGVAAMHAVVESTDAGIAVIDLGSAAKTLVNGEAVTRRALRDGDVLTIGDAELRLRVYR